MSATAHYARKELPSVGNALDNQTETFYSVQAPEIMQTRISTGGIYNPERNGNCGSGLP